MHLGGRRYSPFGWVSTAFALSEALGKGMRQKLSALSLYAIRLGCRKRHFSVCVLGKFIAFIEPVLEAVTSDRAEVKGWCWF